MGNVGQHESEGYTCTESVSNASQVVNSLSDAKQFALQILNDSDLSIYEEEIRDCFETSEAASEAIKSYRDAWHDRMLELAHEVWESRDSYE